MSTILKETVKIGLSKDSRQKGADVLAAILANQHVLYMKTRNFHWNLTGFRFKTLHTFFEEQYEALAKAIDQTAERMRMLGAVAPGSMAEMLKAATLAERPGALIDGEEALKLLHADHETVIRDLREAIDTFDEKCHDVGTADFLTGLIRAHENLAWMLRSFIE
ncbi:DNA starvation/stationary phase protection protein [Luteolibacter ambystomatis]|uniref:DNA starvation/stationary phase protection protein n=1 Tax=Luteolibacter ambystomatis TaxID=2824561 RepID=A0A975G741_9BACT|nr:DNA starvation/stationary phase protection protein [Luteolibacter ambystomatis]QUE50304.1 DNA starvation/stationary phase protection protein [Luteolibacter ambystomatis]